MSATEIILIIIGFIAAAVGYIMPAHMGAGKIEEDEENARQNIRDMTRGSVSKAKSYIKRHVEETMEESLIKSERGMERITNDKINAISDYAGSVLDDIHKNHDEVVFMYDILNDKHKNLTGLVMDVSKSAGEARQTVLDAELTAKESMETANAAMEQILKAREELNDVLKNIKIASPNNISQMASSYTDRFSQEPASSYTDRFSQESSFPSSDRISQTAPSSEKSYKNFDFGDAKSNGSKFSPLSTPRSAFDSDDMHRVIFGVLDDDKNYEDFSSKVIPISGAGHDLRNRSDIEASYNVTTNGALAYAEETFPVRNDNLAVKERQQRILEMYNSGKSGIAIARELGIGIGEVKLIIDLFNGKHNRNKRV